MNTALTVAGVEARLRARFGVKVVLQVSYELRMWRVRVFDAAKPRGPFAQLASAIGDTLDGAFTSLLWPEGRATRAA